MNWKKLVEERDEWVAANFTPGEGFPESRVDTETLIGCVEEVGELAHAHLKASQRIRGTADEHEADAKDAIADCVIYLLGVMSHVGVPDFRAPTRGDTSNQTLLRVATAVGDLCRQPSCYNSSRIVSLLRGYCAQMGWDFEEIVESTWAKVKQRDWKKNPQDGGESEIKEVAPGEEFPGA